ncbi:hypothetical protein AOLI_G00021530 [Acnodon oligacanthus]
MKCNDQYIVATSLPFRSCITDLCIYYLRPLFLSLFHMPPSFSSLKMSGILSCDPLLPHLPPSQAKSTVSFLVGTKPFCSSVAGVLHSGGTPPSPASSALCPKEPPNQ